MQEYHCALGTALVFEGIMSALYHICPNWNNRQFDLVFVFVLLTLVLMKNLTLCGSLKSNSEGLAIAVLAGVATTFAGTFLQYQCVMTAVFSITVAGSIIKQIWLVQGVQRLVLQL